MPKKRDRTWLCGKYTLTVRGIVAHQELTPAGAGREKKVIKKQREDLVEAELFNLQQVQQLEFEKAKNSADKCVPPTAACG